MDKIVKKRVLKTKMGIVNVQAPRPNSKFHVFENKKTGKKVIVEELATADIEANRNSAYKYLA